MNVQTLYICLAMMIVFNCLLNVSLSLYFAACWVFRSGFILLMWSISFSINFLFVSARSMISKSSALMEWLG